MLDCCYRTIELWQENLLVLICSFLCGNCFGQYIELTMMKMRFYEIDDFFPAFPIRKQICPELFTKRSTMV